MADSMFSNDEAAIDELEFAVFSDEYTLIQEATARVEPGAYAHSPNPPCMPAEESRCFYLQAFLPLTAQVTQVELFAKDAHRGNWALCRPNRETPIGWSFFGPIDYKSSPPARSVGCNFKNWKHDWYRDILMRVYYSVPNAVLESMGPRPAITREKL